MAEFKEISPNATATRQTRQLVRQPLSFGWVLLQGPHVAVLRAEELQLLVLLRLAGAAGAGDPDRHRHLPGDALQAGCGHRLRLGRVHHARRALGLADPLHALHGRVRLLRRGLPAHVPGPDLRQLPQAARAGLGLRLRDLPGADGRGLHGLPAALGPDVLLGRPGDHQPVLRHPVHRAGPVRVAARRLCGVRRDPQPLLLLSTSSPCPWSCWAWSRRTSWRCTTSARTIPTASRSRAPKP